MTPVENIENIDVQVSPKTSPKRLEDYREMMSADDVAEYFGVRRGTVYNLVHTGKLQFLQVGKQYRIPREDLRPDNAAREDYEAIEDADEDE